MAILTAAEAYRRVEAGDSESVREELKKIETQILEAIDQGKYSTYADTYLKPGTKKELERLGYSVTSSSYRNESSTVISWPNAGVTCPDTPANNP